jgi:hypothetical protein
MIAKIRVELGGESNMPAKKKGSKPKKVMGPVVTGGKATNKKKAGKKGK